MERVIVSDAGACGDCVVMAKFREWSSKGLKDGNVAGDKSSGSGHITVAHRYGNESSRRSSRKLCRMVRFALSQVSVSGEVSYPRG